MVCPGWSSFIKKNLVFYLSLDSLPSTDYRVYSYLLSVGDTGVGDVSLKRQDDSSDPYTKGGRLSTTGPCVSYMVSPEHVQVPSPDLPGKWETLGTRVARYPFWSGRKSPVPSTPLFDSTGSAGGRG